MQWVWGPFAWNSTDATWELPPGCFSALDYRRLSDMGPETVGMRNFALFAADDAATFGVDHFVLGSGNPRNIPMGLARRTRMQTDLVLPTTPQAGNLAELAAELFLLHSDPDGADMARPLVPTMRRQWELTVAGNSVVIPFSQAHGAYDRLKTLLRRVYKRHYDDVQAGNLPSNHHRKWLGAQMRKYFGRLDDLRYREFQGVDVPDETPLMPTTTVSDNFNRANESLDVGNWTEVSQDWGVVSNTAQLVSGIGSGIARYNTALSSDDHYSQALCSNISGSGIASNVIVRKDSSATLTFYRFYNLGGGSPTRDISKLIGGTPTTLASDASGSASTVTLKLQVDGSSLEAFYNGASILTVTDSAITGNTYAGIGCGRVTSSTTIDDFEAADLVADSGIMAPNSRRIYKSLLAA